MNALRALRTTAASEFRKSEVIDLLGIGLGTAWLFLGVRTFMGLKKSDYMQSTYARRWYYRYNKLAKQEKLAHAAHPAH